MKQIVILFGAPELNEDESEKLFIISQKYAFEIQNALSKRNVNPIVYCINELCDIDQMIYMMQCLNASNSEIVYFNCILGHTGYDGTITSVLEKCKTNFVGANSLLQKICNDKFLMGDLARDVVNIPDRYLINPGTYSFRSFPLFFNYSTIVKPNKGAGSRDIQIFDIDKLRDSFSVKEQSLLEIFIGGQDITSLVLYKKNVVYSALIKTKENFYLKSIKDSQQGIFEEFHHSSLNYICNSIQSTLLNASPLRIDFKYADNKFYLLDVNTQPSWEDDASAYNTWKLYNADKSYPDFLLEIIDEA